MRAVVAWSVFVLTMLAIAAMGALIQPGFLEP